MAKAGYILIPLALAASAVLGDHYGVNRKIDAAIHNTDVKPQTLTANYSGIPLEAYLSNGKLELSYNGKTFDVNTGTLGPRVGDANYAVDNLTLPEKVTAIDTLTQELPDISKKILSEMWKNRQSVYSDLKSKLNTILNGKINGGGNNGSN